MSLINTIHAKKKSIFEAFCVVFCFSRKSLLICNVFEMINAHPETKFDPETVHQ